MFNYKNPDKVLISDFCQVTDEVSIKNFSKMNKDEQKSFLQQRTVCFKKLKPEKIGLVKTLIELGQNKTMARFLNQSLVELIEFSKVIIKPFFNSLNS
jgi:hypothetical protein